MKISRQLFPHPVLGIQDDVKGDFKVDFSYLCDKDRYILKILLKIENKNLNDLITKKMAAYLVTVECANTFFRESFVNTTENFEIEIKEEKLRDEVKVQFFLVALSEIDNYSNESFHEDYNNASFFIEKGDILAYGGEAVFFAEKSYEALMRVSSIMEITEGEFNKGLSKADFGEEKIKIILSKENFKTYLDYCNNPLLFPVFHAGLVFPLLLKALDYISRDVSDYSDKKWFKVIRNRIHNENLSAELEDDEKHYELLQKLFGDPYKRFFNSIKEINEAFEYIE